jgi:hypothetical protein
MGRAIAVVTAVVALLAVLWILPQVNVYSPSALLGKDQDVAAKPKTKSRVLTESVLWLISLLIHATQLGQESHILRKYGEFPCCNEGQRLCSLMKLSRVFMKLTFVVSTSTVWMHRDTVLSFTFLDHDTTRFSGRLEVSLGISRETTRR